MYGASRLRIAAAAVLVAAAAAGAAPPAAPQPASADVAAVRALDSLWARNYATHDTVNADRLMAADFFMTSGAGAVKTKAAELGDIRPAPGLRMEYFRTESPHVHVYGAVAVVSGVAAWAFEQNGRSAAVRRKYTAIYTRGGALGWRLQELHMAAA